MNKFYYKNCHTHKYTHMHELSLPTVNYLSTVAFLAGNYLSTLAPFLKEYQVIALEGEGIKLAGTLYKGGYKHIR